MRRSLAVAPSAEIAYGPLRAGGRRLGNMILPEEQLALSAEHLMLLAVEIPDLAHTAAGAAVRRLAAGQGASGAQRHGLRKQKNDPNPSFHDLRLLQTHGFFRIKNRRMQAKSPLSGG